MTTLQHSRNVRNEKFSISGIHGTSTAGARNLLAEGPKEWPFNVSSSSMTAAQIYRHIQPEGLEFAMHFNTLSEPHVAIHIVVQAQSLMKAKELKNYEA